MNPRTLTTVLLLASGLCAAQPLSAADLPSEYTRGLTPAQVQTALQGLQQAGAPECDSALTCLSRSMANVRIATSLAREQRTADQIAVVIGLPAEAAEEAPAERVVLTLPKWAPSRGPANAPVTIVTWLDYQCPFSQRLQGTFKELEQAYPGKVRFVVRHNPLAFHLDAQALALMSMAAHERSRFWEFHDGLFGSSGKGSLAASQSIARAAKLDPASLAKAARETRLIAQLTADIAEAKRVGADGTPTSYVNGLKVGGAQPLATWSALIDAELASASPARLGK